MPIRSALLLIALCLTGLRTPDAQAQEILNTLWPRAIAQAGDEQTAIPDTTTPWRYFPLAAGNVWEYQDADGLVLRMVIVRDSTFDGHHYFQLDYRGYGRGPAYAQFSHYDLYLRYDTTEQRAYENHPNVEDESIYPYTPCALNAPFDEIADCGFAGSWYVGGRYDGVLVFGGERPGEGSDTLRTPVKSFIQLGVGLERRLAAGIGLIYHSVEGYGWGLVYARVGGVEYGERRIIVGNEPEEQPSASDSATIALYPNPARDHLTLVVNTTSAARVEMYDALGRVMTQQEVSGGAGSQTVSFDVSVWPAGIYFARLVADGGVSSTHPFVVQR